jgi:hypothetical protein
MNEMRMLFLIIDVAASILVHSWSTFARICEMHEIVAEAKSETEARKIQEQKRVLLPRARLLFEI